MNTKFVTLFFAFLLVFSLGFAQDAAHIERLDPIPVPDPSLNGESGTGNMVTNVDFDEDGKMDVFIVSHNWGDGATEMTPRLYKYEMNDEGAWTVVWACSLASIEKQNTWPALTSGDLDGDGKQEIIWGPVNWATATQPNPDRIVVFEEVEASGSDELGVSDGNGNYLPNAKSSILSEDSANMRPFKFIVGDFDFDDTTEVAFCDRVGNWYFGLLSVSDIPDNGDGSETWTVEAEGKTLGISAENKWDIAYLDSVFYLFDEVQTDRVKWTGSEWVLLTPQKTVLEGAGSWKSAVVADLDGNAKKEIIAGTWYTSVVGGHGIWVLEGWDADGTTQLDSLKATKVADLSQWMSNTPMYGVYGGAWGDFDGNGKPDYVFGSRNSTPNAAIFRLEYVGAQNGVANPDNWELSIIDSLFTPESNDGRWGIIGMADIDGDPGTEVLYTSSVPAGGDLFNPAFTQPIVVLDYVVPVVAGPYVWRDATFKYDGDVIPAGGGYHGVTVDKYDRIWTARYATGLECLTAAGDTVFLVDSANVKTDAGIDTTLFLTSLRGVEVDKDGNIIAAKAGFVVKLSVEDGTALAWTPLAGSPLKPAIDGEGYIYVGLVVGTSPVSVIDPATFKVTQTIDLPRPASYARGMAVSVDGMTLIPGDLTGAIHSLPVYTSTDFVNYAITDSIFNDSEGNPILINQTVTVDRDANGRFWISQDGAYGGAGDPRNAENAMIMIDMENNQYTSVPMPEPRTDVNGPRGAAWTSTGDTMYVASWNAGRLYRYISDPTAISSLTSVPLDFELSQNYPNPFNPVTYIEFNLAKAGKTTLTVYNVLGQKVETLLDRNMASGKYKVSFDAAKYASGTYVYELKSDNKVVTKKMVLLK